jgi:hypothetical protein
VCVCVCVCVSVSVSVSVCNVVHMLLFSNPVNFLNGIE